MEGNGNTVQVEDVINLSTVKIEHQVPQQLQSYHTAIVDGYIIEGHVPIAEVERLLEERPDIAGLAVSGMPIGSPGMDVDGAAAQPYEVIAFHADGRLEVYASYNQ